MRDTLQNSLHNHASPEHLQHHKACLLTLQANFVEKLKGDFENLSIAIANLPVGLIPFPDR